MDNNRLLNWPIVCLGTLGKLSQREATIGATLSNAIAYGFTSVVTMGDQWPLRDPSLSLSF